MHQRRIAGSVRSLNWLFTGSPRADDAADEPLAIASFTYRIDAVVKIRSAGQRAGSGPSERHANRPNHARVYRTTKAVCR